MEPCGTLYIFIYILWSDLTEYIPRKQTCHLVHELEEILMREKFDLHWQTKWWCIQIKKQRILCFNWQDILNYWIKSFADQQFNLCGGGGGGSVCFRDRMEEIGLHCNNKQQWLSTNILEVGPREITLPMFCSFINITSLSGIGLLPIIDKADRGSHKIPVFRFIILSHFFLKMLEEKGKGVHFEMCSSAALTSPKDFGSLIQIWDQTSFITAVLDGTIIQESHGYHLDMGL